MKDETSFDGNNWDSCSDLGVGFDQEKKWVDATCPDHTYGQHIKITLFGSLPLRLCEVNAWGYAGKYNNMQLFD